MTVLPVGFTQHQSGVDRVEVPLYFSTGRLRGSQKTKNDKSPVVDTTTVCNMVPFGILQKALLPLL